MPNLNSSVINNLYDQAKNSNLQQRLAAAVVNNNKQLSDSFCNSERNLCRGKYIPSLHAEQRAILAYYGLKVNYNKYRGWYFYDEDYKSKKLDIAVIRVLKNGNFANARPCRKCLCMMKDLGIKKVYYSNGVGDSIITENVKDMFSINDSSSIRRFERMLFNYPKDDIEYYKLLLRKFAPDSIKMNNLIYFLNFSLKFLLPSCRYSFETIKDKNYFKIEDEKETISLIRIL